MATLNELDKAFRTPEVREMQKLYDAAVKHIPGLSIRAGQQLGLRDIALMLAGTTKLFVAESPTGVGKSLIIALAAIHAVVQHKLRVLVSTPRIDLQRNLLATFTGGSGVLGKLGKKSKLRAALFFGKRNYLSVKALRELSKNYADNTLAAKAIDRIILLAQRHCGDLESIYSDTKLLGMIEGEMSEDMREDFQIDGLRLIGRSKSAKKDGQYIIVDGDAEVEKAEVKDDRRDNLPMVLSKSRNSYYYDKAYVKAAYADIIITNHTMVALDALKHRANGEAKFFPFDGSLVILDEAHSFPATVKGLMTYTASIDKIRSHVKAIAKVVDQRTSKTILGLVSRIIDANSSIASTMAKSDQVVYLGPPGDTKTKRMMNGIIGVASNVHQLLGKILKKLDTKTVQKLDLASHKNILLDHHLALDSFIYHGGNLVAKDDDVSSTACYVARVSKHSGNLSFIKAAVSAAYPIRLGLMEHASKLICLSGTLVDTATLNKDQYGATYNEFLGNMGFMLNKRYDSETKKTVPMLPPSITTRRYLSDFNWKQQSHIYIDANTTPKLSENAKSHTAEREMHAKICIRHMIDTIEPAAKGGGIVVLCTSYEHVRQWQKHYAEMGGNRNLVLQARGSSLRRLQDEFEQDYKNSILVTPNGWEGINLPGDMLTDILITQLPFSSPDSPEHLAMKRYQQGTLYCSELTRMQWKVRQGIGRLIRKVTDKGRIYIIDNRLVLNNTNRPLFNYLDKTYTVQCYVGAKKRKKAS
jgi:Rad3-related DNA helicase